MKKIQTLLSSISKLSKSGLGHIFGANIVNQVISFVSGFVLIRVLTKSDYGIYSYALNIYSFYALFNGLGIESACLQVCSENREKEDVAESYMKYGLLFGILFNVLLGLIICISGQFIPLKIKEAKSILMLFAVMPLITTFFNCIQIYFRYNLMNQTYARCSIINTLLILIGSIVGAVIFKTAGLIIFRELAMAVSVIVAIVVYKFPLVKIARAAKISIQQKLDVLKIALISTVNIATGQLLYLIDVFVIGLLISDALVIASYKTATIIPNALLFIPTSVAIYVYPYFAEKQQDKKWVKKSFFTILKYFAPVNALISVTMIALAPLIISILFGEQYLDAVPAFRILSLSYFFSGTFRKIIGNLLVTQRKLKVNFWIGILESVLNIVSNWVLVNIMGAIGAAVTTLVICIISSVVSMIYFVSYLNREIANE